MLVELSGCIDFNCVPSSGMAEESNKHVEDSVSYLFAPSVQSLIITDMICWKLNNRRNVSSKSAVLKVNQPIFKVQTIASANFLSG